VPALRERAQDIVELADHFLQRFSRRHGRQTQGFSDRAREVMLAYAWPGNVRELQNTVERAVILTGENLPVSCSALGLPVLDRPIASATPVPPAEGVSTGPSVPLRARDVHLSGGAAAENTNSPGVTS
jgi:DNA-binding NtrC family response regulator